MLKSKTNQRVETEPTPIREEKDKNTFPKLFILDEDKSQTKKNQQETPYYKEK